MDDANDPHLAIRRAVDLLDEVLDVAGLENDARAQAALALAFCDRLGDRLDAGRRAAVDAARCYWNRQDGAGRRRWHAVYLSRLERQHGLSPYDALQFCLRSCHIPAMQASFNNLRTSLAPSPARFSRLLPRTSIGLTWRSRDGLRPPFRISLASVTLPMSSARRWLSMAHFPFWMTLGNVFFV